MQTSCIPHPEKEPLVIIHRWQMEFCEEDACAAALISFFEYWHNLKLAIQSRIKPEFQSEEDLWQWHSQDDLSDGILIYGRKSIAEAIKYLEDRGIIKSRTNPDPKYSFDRKKQYLFNPTPLIEFLKTRKPFVSALSKKEQSIEQKETIESEKSNNAGGKNAQAIAEDSKPEITKADLKDLADANDSHQVMPEPSSDNSSTDNRNSQKKKAEKKEPQRSCGQQVYFEVFDKMPRKEHTTLLDQAVFDKGKDHVKEILCEWKTRNYSPNNYLGIIEVIYHGFMDQRAPVEKSLPQNVPRTKVDRGMAALYEMARKNNSKNNQT